MSEFKGQLLGIILVIAAFGVIGGTLVGAFSTSASNVKNQIASVDSAPITAAKVM